jgi:hypothetical protein
MDAHKFLDIRETDIARSVYGDIPEDFWEDRSRNNGMGRQ